MRDILFKAKTAMIVGTYNCGKDDGEWVTGHLYGDVGKWIIRQFEYDRADYVSYEVDPETVCQYIGINENNKNKKKIWENDIVEVIWHSGKIERYLIWWSREMSMMEAISLKDIDFNGHDYWGGQPQIEYSTFCIMMQDPWGDIKEVKVVGNIFDNPELLNKGVAVK